MTNARVVWGEKGQFIGSGDSRHSIVMSGLEREKAGGVTPSELLLISLGGCTAVGIVSILTKKRQPLSQLEIEIEGQQDASPPWAYRKVKLNFRVRGRGLTKAGVRQAIALSERRYCPVAASLRPTVEIETSFEILPEE
jgi:putative redox protein